MLNSLVSGFYMYRAFCYRSLIVIYYIFGFLGLHDFLVEADCFEDDYYLIYFIYLVIALYGCIFVIAMSSFFLKFY